MFSFNSVNFDHSIANWHTPLKEISESILILVVEGKVDYWITDRQVIAEAGDLLFIPKMTKRSGKNYRGQTHQKYTILFNQTKEIQASPPFLSAKQFLHLRTRNYDYLKHRFHRLFVELRGEKQYRTFICSGLLQELIGLIGRELEHFEVAPIKFTYAQTLKQYLLEHYRESVGIEELAKLIQRSPNYTISIFKEVTGYSPIQYMHHLRVMEACSLLLNTGMSIVNIANHLGYYDTSYFSRTFKKNDLDVTEKNLSVWAIIRRMLTFY